MADVVVFHHAQGLTDGVRTFGARLQEAGHMVHLPDLYEGRMFGDLLAGIGHAEEIGVDAILTRGREAVQELPAALVYAGFSLGVLPAQMLAQTRPGAKGALLYHACIPTAAFGGTWPQDVPVRVHGMDADEIFAGEGDLEAAQALVASVANAEIFLYPGTSHLFADSSLPSYDEGAAGLLLERTLVFLEQIG